MSFDDYVRRQTDLPLDGPGQWTLAPARARQLLAEVGRDQPDLGFLRLAQAAYLSGSPQLRWQASSSELEARFWPSAPLTPPLLQWGSEVSPWQQALGIALLVLARRHAVRWKWCGQGEQGSGSAQAGDFREERSGPGAAEALLSVSIASPRGWWWRRQGWRPLRQRLAQRLAWMPMWVYWDDAPLNRLLLGAPDLPLRPGRLSWSAEAFVYTGPGEAGDLWLPDHSLCPTFRARCGDRVWDEPPVPGSERTPLLPGALRGWAALGLTRKGWSETVFIHQGVALDGESNLLDRPGVIAYISAAGLDADLSGLELVHNQAFRERLAMVRDEVRWLDARNSG